MVSAMIWPDLNSLRRSIIPKIEKPVEKYLDRDIICKRAQNYTYVGVITDRQMDAVIADIASRDKHYPVNLAALKWRADAHDASKRVYERASYAYRPNGFKGKYQYHVRLFPHSDGVAVWAHHEINPWYDPKAHYDGVDWNPKKGRKWAIENFDIDTSVDMDGVTTATKYL